jgi:hypothetical protein
VQEAGRLLWGVHLLPQVGPAPAEYGYGHRQTQAGDTRAWQQEAGAWGACDYLLVATC